MGRRLLAARGVGPQPVPSSGLVPTWGEVELFPRKACLSWKWVHHTQGMSARCLCGQKREEELRERDKRDIRAEPGRTGQVPGSRDAAERSPCALRK
jgi:hypothetical protein